MYVYNVHSSFNAVLLSSHSFGRLQLQTSLEFGFYFCLQISQNGFRIEMGKSACPSLPKYKKTLKFGKLAQPNSIFFHTNRSIKRLPTLFNLQKYYNPVSFIRTWALLQSKKGLQKGSTLWKRRLRFASLSSLLVYDCRKSQCPAMNTRVCVGSLAAWQCCVELQHWRS